MALADDELDALERARVEAIVAVRPDLQDRLAAFTATGKVLAPQFRKPLDEPLPQHLVDLVMGGDLQVVAANASSSANVESQGILSKLRQRLHVELPRWTSALAYSAVLVVGAAIGWYLSHASIGGAPSTLDDGRLVAGGALARSLEITLSGARPTLGSAETGLIRCSCAHSPLHSRAQMAIAGTTRLHDSSGGVAEGSRAATPTAVGS